MRVQLEIVGMVTALAAFRDGTGEYVALGGRGQVSLAPATTDGVGPLRWTAAVDFEPRVVLWDGASVWAAGSERAADAIDDYDWDALGGGGFAALDPTDGRVVVSRNFEKGRSKRAFDIHNLGPADCDVRLVSNTGISLSYTLRLTLAVEGST
jgi:hypothetical protein